MKHHNLPQVIRLIILALLAFLLAAYAFRQLSWT